MPPLIVMSGMFGDLHHSDVEPNTPFLCLQHLCQREEVHQPCLGLLPSFLLSITFSLPVGFILWDESSQEDSTHLFCSSLLSTLHCSQHAVEAPELSRLWTLPTFFLSQQCYGNLLAVFEVTKAFIPSFLTFLCGILSTRHIL